MDRRNTDYYIKIIAELQSVSAAADRLGVSQPALSASLKKKEQELGILLFDRSRQPIELTDAGSAYLEYVERKDKLESEMFQQIADISGLQTGKLTAGGAIAFNIAYLPKAVEQFENKYPGVEINLLDRSVPELVNEALKGNLDIFITPQDSDYERFEYQELLEEKLLVCVPKSIAEDLGLKESISKEDFRAMCEYPFVVLREDQDVGRKMRELWEFYGCEPARTVRVEQTMTTLALSMSGVGISLISEGTLKSLNIKPDNSSLVFLKAEPSICTRKLYVAWPKNKYLAKTAQEFINTIKEVNND